MAPLIVLILTIALLGLGHFLGWGTALAGLFLAAPPNTVATPTVPLATLPDAATLDRDRAQLLLEIAQLKEELTILQQAHGGSVHLPDALDEYEVESARVLYRDPSQTIPAFVIDRGSQQGILVGQPVLGQLSVIGRVSAVWPGRARVDLLTRPGVAFGAVVQNSRVLGIVESSGGQLGLDFVAKGSSVSSGEMVVTSGVPGYTPVGLPLGMIESVGEESESLTLRIALQPLENPWTLSVVHVVKIDSAPLSTDAIDDLADAAPVGGRP